jgi:diketogulonate reductase-like aldo/keto reductase
MKQYMLYNGVQMPALGAGTWQIPDAVVSRVVSDALACGYRHIDTAAAYQNEAGVGRAIKQSGIMREELFVTTKLSAEIKGYEETLAAFSKSLAALDLEYLDLYLIHAPWPWDAMGTDHIEGNLASWKAMEQLYHAGKVRAIGVSNFGIEHLEPILAQCEIKPMVNQISYYPGHIQPAITDFCLQQGILVESYAPLATGAALKEPLLAAMAEKYQASVAQICIAYVLQKGRVTIPKSTHRERLEQNFQTSILLSEADMKAIDALDPQIR